MTEHPTGKHADLAAEVWQRLIAAAGDPRDSMRLCTLATITTQATPDARLLILRGADRDDACLWFHADRRSNKIRQLKERPEACVVAYDPTERMQLRLYGTVTVHEGDTTADHHWEQLEFAVRDRYAESANPGADLSPPDPRIAGRVRAISEHDDQRGRDNFAVLRVGVERIDWLLIGEPDDLRAVMRRDDGWSVRPLHA